MRPRQYAASIMLLSSKEERRTALAEVPESMRSLVESHVRNVYERNKYTRRAGKSNG